MNSRERLTAIARGGPVDRAAWFTWVPNASYSELLHLAREYAPDGLVTSSMESAKLLLEELGLDGPAVLFEVMNPFGLALQDEINLNSSIQADPSEAYVLHSKYATEVADSMEWALSAGCDGVFYRLVGAAPEWSTPMQYGGHHLESDRELLGTVRDARFNTLYVEGGEGVYLDFVSDLPASAFAWDEMASGVDYKEVRKLRDGALACGLMQDRSSIWADMNYTGVVFFAKCSFDDEFDAFSRECHNLRSPAPHE